MRIVVALGGNALGNTPEEQLNLVRSSSRPIVDLIEAGHHVVLAHGNGPQVGMINLAMQIAAEVKSEMPEIPLPECGAMSQGYIGYHLQNALYEEIKRRDLKIPVATIATQVIVSSEDPAFSSPSKPIGLFYSEEKAKQLTLEKQWTLMEDAGRGWRRVVPSPKPVDIVEKESISALVDKGHLVIAVGGGGIPVVKNNERLMGVAAVIDKDFASAKLAELLNADYLIMLTGVDQVAIHYGKPDETWLSQISVKDAEQYINEGHFAPGSMLPKVEAAITFAKSQPGRKALITSLEKAKAGIDGETGTVITEH